ncbi:hypothetical protein BGY98DRAFT_1188694 [Russula aff. rugulosa BPL654]|nr:hypothetical protein BGY98DRAFT_1188694 [Russula aff. rugulosa BPL654]
MSTDQKHLCICRDTERAPIINRLPGEVLLEIFDSYRQNITDKYDHYWRKNYAWFNLAHVCRKWRAAMLASFSRLDLNVVVGPVKPGNIKTILSGHLPILIDYLHSYGPRENNGSAVWRMRAALGHRDRVRSISFQGHSDDFKKFIKATNYHFPALESLVLCFPEGYEPEIPATFLRGSDRSDLPVRRLGLYGGSIAFFVSGILSSATALTDLTLNFTTSNLVDFDVSQGSSFLACLQGMQRLRKLDLTIQLNLRVFLSESEQSPDPKDTTVTVPMSELTHFYYSGPNTFLNHLMSRISAPSLQDARFQVCAKYSLPYLSRVIDDVREEFRSVSVTFDSDNFHLVSSTHLGDIDHFKPSESSFRLNVNCSPYSIDSMNSTPSTKLSIAEELTLNFPGSNMTGWEDIFSMRDFLRQFRSVRVLRVNPFVREIGLYLKQDEDGQEASCPYWKKSRYQYRAQDLPREYLIRTGSTSAVQPKQWQFSSQANERVTL